MSLGWAVEEGVVMARSMFEAWGTVMGLLLLPLDIVDDRFHQLGSTVSPGLIAGKPSIFGTPEESTMEDHPFI